MSEPGSPTVADFVELLADAYELIAGAPRNQEERSWLASYSHLIDSLDGSQRALYSRICEALGSASVCWDPKPEGVFQPEEVEKIAHELLGYIDSYADQLPLVRPADTMSREEVEPADRLAAAIYEISTRIGTGLVETWSDAPDEIKDTLRRTAAEILRKRLTDPEEGELTAEEAVAPPGEFQRPYCLPGCNRLDGHDGRDPGACMRNGTVIVTGLPPDIGMPPGFRKEDRDGRTNGTASGSS